MATTTPPLTPMVDWIAQAATTAGLAPHTYRKPYRGAVEVRLGVWSGPAGVFGGFEVGLLAGRVLRGWLRNGNDGDTTRYNTGRDLLRALHQLT